MNDEIKFYKETTSHKINFIFMDLILCSFFFYYFLEVNEFFQRVDNHLFRLIILVTIIVIFVLSLFADQKWRIILTHDSITKKGIFFESSILFVDVINIEISKHYGYRLITKRINFTLGGENHIENREELIEGIETRLKQIGVDVENITLRTSTPWLLR